MMLLGIGTLSQLFLMASADSLLFLETEQDEGVVPLSPITKFNNSTTTTTTSVKLSPKSNSSSLPINFRTMSDAKRNVVIAYSLFFVLGASGNLSVFLSVCRQLGKLK